MTEMSPFAEVEFLLQGLSLLIILVVIVFVGIAYYRTRLRRLLVLLLLAGLLAVNVVIELAEHLLVEGVPYDRLVTSLFGLLIAVLLLATVIRRFEWSS